MPSDPPELVALKKIAKIDFKGKKIPDLIPRMERMLSEGLLCKEQKDYRKAYILLSRYVQIYEYIRQQKEYKLDPKKYNLPSHHSVNDAVTSLEYVNKCFIEKCTVANLISENQKLNGVNNTGDEVLFNLPEAPTDDPVNDSSDNVFIKCNDFHKMTKESGNKYLIIDVRPSHDYNKSKIKSDRVINIEEDVVKPGMISSKFEKILYSNNRDHYNLFTKRGKKWVDKIILLDWSTSKDNITDDKPVSIMKSILIEWEQEKLANVLILDGGYSELLHTFPMILSNHDVSPPTNGINNFDDEILDGVSYPEWMKDLDKKKPDQIQIISSNIPINYENILNTDNIDDKSFGVNQLSKDISQINIKSNGKIMPTIPDRSGKPITNFDRQYALNLIKAMEDLIELSKKQEKLVKQIHKLEEDLYTCLTEKRSNDYDDADSLKPQIAVVQETIDRLLDARKIVEDNLDKLNKLNKTLSKGDMQVIDKLSLEIKSSEMRLHGLMKERKSNKLKIINVEDKKRELLNSQIDDDQIHKEPLKSEGTTTSSGLKRSLSSPNLAKTEMKKTPMIDRSTKPFPIYKQQNEINNNRRLPWKDRTVNMDPIYRNGHPGITGLKNLGNSCYMNSIIQCLSNTMFLTKYLIDGVYQDDLNTGSDNETRGHIAEEFAQVIRALWRGQYKSIAPRDLKDTIGQFRQQFHSHEQQDSHEFLTFFLEWMHNDLRKDTKLKIESKMTPAEKAWDKELKGQYSIISQLFIGQFRSTIQCQTCHKKSITYETFSSLSISLPDTNRCTLDDCIERFLRAQEIQGWTCPNCKTNRDATKKFDFVKLPPILVVHLNRFAGTTIKLEKKNTFVTFPVEDLNLECHLVHDDDTNWNRTHGYLYNLYGLSNHYGSMDGGHYTAYCKNASLDKWYKYDDQTVTEIARNDVKTQNTSAYLLFYTSYVPYIDDR